MPSITHLNQLEADGLISLSQILTEPVYLFRQALVQETAYQWKIYALQTDLYFREGDTTRSKESQTHAVEIINKIGASAGDSSLRKQFVTLPAVQAILTNRIWAKRQPGGE